MNKCIANANFLYSYVGGFISEHVFLPTLSGAMLAMSTEKVLFHL